VPTHVLGDPLRLNQILVNLLGNALKFTEHGHIALHVALEQAAPDGQEVRLRFSVDDTGVGISSEQQARLFQAFTQADTVPPGCMVAPGWGWRFPSNWSRPWGAKS